MFRTIYEILIKQSVRRNVNLFFLRLPQSDNSDPSPPHSHFLHQLLLLNEQKLLQTLTPAFFFIHEDEGHARPLLPPANRPTPLRTAPWGLFVTVEEPFSLFCSAGLPGSFLC